MSTCIIQFIIQFLLLILDTVTNKLKLVSMTI